MPLVFSFSAPRAERRNSPFFASLDLSSLSLSLSLHYHILTATLRDARDGTLSSVEWRYRSTVALAASTAVGASEAMPTTASSTASAAKRADDETILFSFFSRVGPIKTRCVSPGKKSNQMMRIAKKSKDQSTDAN